MNHEVINADCLEAMANLPDASIDACITDVPYGTTACSWDSPIPFAPMWAALKRIVKRNGAIVLFGSQPFTSALVMSNPQMFRYQWYWQKTKPVGFLDANRRPLNDVEDLLVFSAEQSVFNPQMVLGEKHSRGTATRNKPVEVYSGFTDTLTESEHYYPRRILTFSNEVRPIHPTQKPIELMRYLVRTYSNEGDTILDFTCGSGSTGVASVIENRNFIGIEKDEHYADVARARIKRASGEWAEIPRKMRADRPAPLFDREAVNY